MVVGGVPHAAAYSVRSGRTSSPPAVRVMRLGRRGKTGSFGGGLTREYPEPSALGGVRGRVPSRLHRCNDVTPVGALLGSGHGDRPGALRIAAMGWRCSVL